MVDQRDYKNRPVLQYRIVADYDNYDNDHTDESTAETIGDLSDGYHTFNELYAHRIELWITVCRLWSEINKRDRRRLFKPWRTMKHSDGTCIEGWFILGMGWPGWGKPTDEQITYHLPMDKWKDCDFAETLEKAHPFDGHTSADVLERLKRL